MKKIKFTPKQASKIAQALQNIGGMHLRNYFFNSLYFNRHTLLEIRERVLKEFHRNTFEDKEVNDLCLILKTLNKVKKLSDILDM